MNKDIAVDFEALDDDFGFWIWDKNIVGPEALDKLEQDIGFKVNADYRAFMLAHGCAALVAKEEVWARAKAYQIGPRWAHEHGIEIFGIAKDVPPPLDLRAHAKKHAGSGLLPVAGIVGGRVLLAQDAKGSWFWLEGASRSPAEPAFHANITAMLETLKEDKEKAKAAGAKLWS